MRIHTPPVPTCRCNQQTSSDNHSLIQIPNQTANPIADLAHNEKIELTDLMEAIQYRSLDQVE